MTIILVTHNMFSGPDRMHARDPAHGWACNMDGRPQLVVDAYRLAASREKNAIVCAEAKTKRKMTSFELLPVESGRPNVKRHPNPASAEPHRLCAGRFAWEAFIRVASPEGITFYTLYSDVSEVPASRRLICEATIPRLMLKGGDYHVWVGLCSEREEEDLITRTPVRLTVKDPDSLHAKEGLFWNHAEWSVR